MFNVTLIHVNSEIKLVHSIKNKARQKGSKLDKSGDFKPIIEQSLKLVGGSAEAPGCNGAKDFKEQLQLAGILHFQNQGNMCFLSI